MESRLFKLHRYLPWKQTNKQRNNFLLTSDCEDKALTVIINSIRAVWWKTAIIRSMICILQVPYHKIIGIIDSIAFNFVFSIWSVWKSKHRIITLKIMRWIEPKAFKTKNKKKCLVGSLFILWGGDFSTINKCFCSSSSSLWLLCISKGIMCPYDNCALLRDYLSWLTQSTPQIGDGKGTVCCKLMVKELCVKSCLELSALYASLPCLQNSGLLVWK